MEEQKVESLKEISSKIIKTLKKEEVPALPEERIITYIPEYMAKKHMTPEDSIKLLQEGILEYFKNKSLVPFAINKFEFLDYNHNEKYKEALEQVEEMLKEERTCHDDCMCNICIAKQQTWEAQEALTRIESQLEVKDGQG
ncbi:hypothetical protein LCGC14_2069550 [marine sediment metagenome]|uniref:Uncharacterized protein n=1 Tax=marine sediment metagenome TaxID=412755 RepID=A0A0F9EIY3_9ZZZZ